MYFKTRYFIRRNVINYGIFNFAFTENFKKIQLWNHRKFYNFGLKKKT